MFCTNRLFRSRFPILDSSVIIGVFLQDPPTGKYPNIPFSKI